MKEGTEEFVLKINGLINEGRNLLRTESYEKPDFSFDSFSNSAPEIDYYDVVDEQRYPSWRIKSLTIIKLVTGTDSFYIKEFEENCKAGPSEHSLNQGLGILEAIKNGLEDGTLNAISTISSPASSKFKRIEIDRLPNKIGMLVEELNDNLDRNNLNSCALLIRKILTISSFLALAKIDKQNLIDDKELSTVLGIIQNEFHVDTKLMAKVKSAKWIGDSANHSYHIEINESDVETAATGLRLFLGELFDDEKGADL